MRDDREKVDIQCTRVKQQVYMLKEFVEGIQHENDRVQALELFNKAYNDIDALQSFIKSR